MRKIAGILMVLIVAGCSKTPDPIPTTAERLAQDIVTIDTYLAKYNVDAVKLENGVRYLIKETGTGALPTKDNCIRFRYAGYAINDSTAFDSNNEDGLKAPLKALVSGIQVGLKKMPVGTKGVIFIPSGYGYPNGVWNSEANAYKLEPNTPIWFEVEIVALYDYNTAGNYCYE